MNVIDRFQNILNRMYEYFTPQPQNIIELYNLQEASNFVRADPAIESHKILFIFVRILLLFIYKNYSLILFSF